MRRCVEQEKAKAEAVAEQEKAKAEAAMRKQQAKEEAQAEREAARAKRKADQEQKKAAAREKAAAKREQAEARALLAAKVQEAAITAKKELREQAKARAKLAPAPHAPAMTPKDDLAVRHEQAVQQAAQYNTQVDGAAGGVSRTFELPLQRDGGNVETSERSVGIGDGTASYDDGSSYSASGGNEQDLMALSAVAAAQAQIAQVRKC